MLSWKLPLDARGITMWESRPRIHGNSPNTVGTTPVQKTGTGTANVLFSRHCA